jgi:hypothetical protein
MTTADCRLPHIGVTIIAWCGALAVARVLPISGSPLKKVAGMALGAALLILARLVDTDRGVAASEGPVVRAARRLWPWA